METIHAGYWKISSLAAINGYDCRKFHRVTPRPTWDETPMHAPETHEALGAFNPIGRIGETTDIADAILFLDSAPFITGEILHVDGGQSAGH